MMNDPTQNELLSAYLDGELSAAEQAEVERLLAADPAARHILEDLRALSAALRALPREELGEDLSAEVLRAAGRRVLLEGPPNADDSATAVPLGRAFLGRELNARIIAYAGITIALAVVIMIVDSQQERIPAEKAGKEIAAAAPQKNELQQEQEEPGYLPPIQGVRDSIAESSRLSGVHSGRKIRGFSEPSDKALAAPPPPQSPPPAESPPGFASPAGDAEPSSAPNRELRAQARRGGDMLVVHCDVTPEALANNDFDKLLAANGITQRRQFKASVPPDAENRWEGKAGKGGSPSLSDSAAPLGADEVNMVYVEAAPDRIEAALAALGTNRRAFSNVMVSTPRGSIGDRSEAARTDAAPEGSLHEAPQRPTARGLARSKAVPHGAGESFDAPPDEDATAERGAEPAAALKEENQADKGKETLEKRESADKKDADAERPDASAKAGVPPRQRTAPTQRVLFVLRVVPADAPRESDSVGESQPAESSGQTPPSPADAPPKKQ
ncbi:MAG: hypothetical protein GX594_08845 [Pirellulaceae bacterium]|nr:hypothetical protein [Pirellulaceae bacterium]